MRLLAAAALLALVTLQAPALPPSVEVKDHGNVDREAFPVSGAIPFPRAALRDADLARLALARPTGEEVPVQYRVNGRWPDGSVRWLHLDFASTQKAGASAVYALKPLASDRLRRPDLARKTDAGVGVDTGRLKVLFAPDRWTVHARLDGRWVPASEGPLRSRIRVDGRMDHDLPLHAASIEENGPERAVLKIEGTHRAKDGSEFSPSVVRFTFHRDSPFVRIDHTWVMSEDPARAAISRIGLDLPVSFPVRELDYGTGTLALQGRPAGVFQRANTVEPAYPHPRREFDTEYEVFDGDRVVSRGKRHPGALALKGEGLDGGVWVRDFWQMAPKAVTCGSRTLSIDFWPERAGDLDLRRTEERNPPHFREFMARDPLARHPKYSPKSYVPYTLENSALGISRTHEVVLSFSPRESASRMALLFSTPFVPFAGGAWNVSTGVLGKQILPGKRPDIDACSAAVVERVIREADERGWYGDLVYGSVRYLFEERTGSWMAYHPKFAWFNSEHLMFLGGNLHHVMWQQYLRTGSPRAYAFAEARGRAKADLSVIHHGPAKASMVRHGGYDPWVGARRANGEHASLCGLDLQHYVTGSARALDVLHLVGRSQIRKAQFNHGRAMATDLDSTMRYWLLTGERKYLDRCLEHLKHYEDTLEKLKTDHGYWQYRVTALQQFHEFCDDDAVRDRIRKVFVPNWENVPHRNPSFRLTDAPLIYELAPTPEHAAYLLDSLPKRLPRTVDDVKWGGEDWPSRILMNEVALLGALWAAAYWADR